MRLIALLSLVFFVLISGVGLFLLTPERSVKHFAKAADFAVQIANPQTALTFAYDQHRAVLLVVAEHPQRGTQAIKLDGEFADAFAALQAYGRRELISRVRSAAGAQWYAQSSLSPITTSRWHIAFGGNFAAHADETDLEQPFAFPKIGAPTAAVSALEFDDAMLLDYEAELCLIFDRPIRSMADFDAAEKGVFLCADTTDRATLLRDLPADEAVFGGTGFTDSKSFPGFFSTGPYLVIPNDWQRFVHEQPMVTYVDGQLMQYAFGSEMIYPFDRMIEYSLAQGNRNYWETQGQQVSLLHNAMISPGSALLSGTGEGVIFRPPGQRDIILGGIAYFVTGSFLHGSGARDYVIERYIKKAQQGKIFLQPGEQVVHQSQNLGAITIDIN